MSVDLLVFGPHPDDLEIGMGGTIALHVSRGQHVVLCDLTRGELGSNGTPEQRLAEAEAARAVLGAAVRINLALPDGALRPDCDDQIRIVAACVRRYRPRSVALPYWRFDRAAPNLFQLDFLGVSDSLGTVRFSNSNPLQFWRTDGVQGINRRPFFNTGAAPPGLLSEAQTLALGTQYRAFRTMEGNPHGMAHTSFGGSISSIGSAARDPLFFLLHCNVDRLWAKWQRQNGRFNAAQAASYDPGAHPIGHIVSPRL